MNTQQKKYALNRIDGLCSIKLREAQEKFTSKAVTISKEEGYKLIANGKVKIKPYKEIDKQYNPDLYPSFDFSEYEKPSKLDEGKYRPIEKSILDISQKAKDQIMLGDCKEALKLIGELENFKI